MYLPTYVLPPMNVTLRGSSCSGTYDVISSVVMIPPAARISVSKKSRKHLKDTSTIVQTARKLYRTVLYCKRALVNHNEKDIIW